MKTYRFMAISCAFLMSAQPMLAAPAQDLQKTVRLAIIGSADGGGAYTARAFSLSVGVGEVTSGGIFGDGNSVATFATAQGTATDTPVPEEQTSFEVQVFPPVD